LRIQRSLILPSIIGLLLLAHCASKGLLTEKHEKSYYQVPMPNIQYPIPDSLSKFIVYSDNQAGWRVQHKFFNRESWASPKMFFFPFYELYLVGNGIIGGINWLRQMPDYGKRERLLVRDAIYREYFQSHSSFILNVGDICAYDGRRPIHWEIFLNEYKIEHPLLNEIPYFAVVGNHERANDSTYGMPNYQAVFNLPRFYVIEFENAALFILDSNYLIDQNKHIDDKQQDLLFRKWFVSAETDTAPSWLENQLKKYYKKFKIIAMHHPPVAFAHHYQDWQTVRFGKGLEKKRITLIQLFSRFGVDLVFSGHEHIYQHNMLTLEDGRNIHFLLGGGGGTPLRHFIDEKTRHKFNHWFSNQGFEISLLNQARIHHYYLTEIYGDTLSVKILEVTGNKELPTKVFEEIKIVKN